LENIARSSSTYIKGNFVVLGNENYQLLPTGFQISLFNGPGAIRANFGPRNIRFFNPYCGGSDYIQT